MAGTFVMSAGVLLLSIPEFLKVYDLSEIESIKLLFTFYSIIGIVIILCISDFQTRWNLN